MTRQELVVLAAAVVLTTSAVGPASGDVRRTRSERRPYITEVGEPYSVSPATVDREAAKMNQLQDYLHDYGYPDYAEIQEITPEWPWDSYEVRLYYMQRDLETDFGHVLYSPAMPELGVLKYLGAIPPDKRHQIEVILQARLAPPVPLPVTAEAAAPLPPAAAVVEQPASGGLTEAVVARLEAAAERASQAADKAVDASEAAAHAADRTVTILDKMSEEGAPAAKPSRRKRFH